MMRIVFYVFVGLLLFGGAAFADTTWVAAGSDVSGDWTDVGSPYIIQGNIHVASIDTLLIGPGVVVYFNGLYRLTVEGTLLCLGVESGPVYFTTDTLFHPTGWGGIRLTLPRGLCRFDHTVIENGRSIGAMEFGFGGGLYCDNAQVEMNYCTVRSCRANSGQGIYCRNQSRLTLSQCLIRDNGSAVGSGGGLYVRSASVVTLFDCDLVNNSAVYGGAATVDGSVLNMERCSIRKNDAINNGGGLFGISSVVTVTHSTFLANTSLGGGAIDGRNDLNLTMDHCLIQSNLAQRQGAQGIGGGFAFASGAQRITNCTFVNNAAGTGGAVYAGSSTRLDNCIIAFQVTGGGVFFPLMGADARFCCFAGNGGGDFGGPLPPGGLGAVNYTNANGDSCDGYMNLFRDPDFDPSAEQSYSLNPGSPCINAGDPQSAHDPDGSVTDIGAYAFVPLDAAPLPVSLPSSFGLRAYPNPFNPSTSFTFAITQQALVTLKVYDVLGQETATLVNARRPAGTYSLNWNAGFLPSGTYFAVLDAGGVRTTQKLLLLK